MKTTNEKIKGLSITRPPVVAGTREGIPVEKGVALTEHFLEKNYELIGQYAGLWITYPDLFLDLITPVGSNFKLYFYQRVFMRVSIRFRYSFSTSYILHLYVFESSRYLAAALILG